MKFQAVIFDMDGVIIDSEFYWAKAEMGFLDKYKIKLSRELTARMTGQSFRENALFLKQHFGLVDSVEEILQGRLVATEPIYTYQAGPMPGASELFPRIKQSGVKLAIASGSTLERINTIVNRFEWGKYFDALVSTDHVNFVGKPDPAIYRHTAEVLQIPPAECVVIEDSVNGLVSAQAAGMRCVAVPDPRWSHGDFSKANLIIESLLDKKLFDFLGIS
ncbi:MAG: HAD family phosphatase [Candidatus Magasanikbacteria bacterium]|nr:HAD family phosphatase [Candidatus Magasanikbacteria bacterium]